ncbi:hypothetical protein GIB67_035247 [Kingdonia uniflora]|uniref:Molybdenum cofactor sulfurase middle domain-containing protein n=1 Tax=Kingdonia uniflora TaxID=39325 RepID=A0A7J7KXU2_9MAGN|nr:hypothetical protein GIB67_035247 [Kingdonia uniflora]
MALSLNNGYKRVEESVKMEKALSFVGSILGKISNGVDEEPTARISSIFIYPIKSCRGISVSQAPITPTGFRWDRQWLVVNSKGRAYTQRVEPKLALVEVELPIAAYDEGWEPTVNSYLESAIGPPDFEAVQEVHPESSISLWYIIA